MIHILNNFSKEYHVLLDGLENHLKGTGENDLAIDSICIKLELRCNKIENKKEEKSKKEKAFGAYSLTIQALVLECGKYGHKSGDWRCPKNINEREENDKRT